MGWRVGSFELCWGAENEGRCSDKLVRANDSEGARGGGGGGPEEVVVPMNGLRVCEKECDRPWLPCGSVEKARARWSVGDVVDGGKYACGADVGAGGGPGGGAEKGSDWSGAPRASWMEGNDWRAGALWGSFSSPDMRRDPGGESNPPSEPETALATGDWRLCCERACNELGTAVVDRFLWYSISSRLIESRLLIDGRPTLSTGQLRRPNMGGKREEREANTNLCLVSRASMADGCVKPRPAHGLAEQERRTATGAPVCFRARLVRVAARTHADSGQPSRYRRWAAQKTTLVGGLRCTAECAAAAGGTDPRSRAQRTGGA